MHAQYGIQVCHNICQTREILQKSALKCISGLFVMIQMLLSYMYKALAQCQYKHDHIQHIKQSYIQLHHLLPNGINMPYMAYETISHSSFYDMM